MPEPPHEGGFAVSASYRESVNSLTLAVEVGAPDRPHSFGVKQGTLSIAPVIVVTPCHC